MVVGSAVDVVWDVDDEVDEENVGSGLEVGAKDDVDDTGEVDEEVDVDDDRDVDSEVVV